MRLRLLMQATQTGLFLPEPTAAPTEISSTEADDVDEVEPSHESATGQETPPPLYVFQVDVAGEAFTAACMHCIPHGFLPWQLQDMQEKLLMHTQAVCKGQWLQCFQVSANARPARGLFAAFPTCGSELLTVPCVPSRIRAILLQARGGCLADDQVLFALHVLASRSQSHCRVLSPSLFMAAMQQGAQVSGLQVSAGNAGQPSFAAALKA